MKIIKCFFRRILGWIGFAGAIMLFFALVVFNRDEDDEDYGDRKPSAIKRFLDSNEDDLKNASWALTATILGAAAAYAGWIMFFGALNPPAFLPDLISRNYAFWVNINGMIFTIFGVIVAFVGALVFLFYALAIPVGAAWGWISNLGFVKKANAWDIIYGSMLVFIGLSSIYWLEKFLGHVPGFVTAQFLLMTFGATIFFVFRIIDNHSKRNFLPMIVIGLLLSSAGFCIVTYYGYKEMPLSYSLFSIFMAASFIAVAILNIWQWWKKRRPTGQEAGDGE